MPMKYECSTCNEVRPVADKRVVKIEKDKGELARQIIDTCVFCLAKGLMITSNTVKVIDVETKKDAG